MGFWHTGYMEFHEPIGFENYIPTPPVHRCQHCGAIFEDPAALRTHRFEKHPYNRPILWVGGIEVGTTPITITHQIIAKDIASNYCQTAWINNTPLLPLHLGEQLALIKKDTVRVKLANEGIDAEFTLRFEVASASDLEGVDHCFLNITHGRRLDMRAISAFIAEAERYPTAIRYTNGVCEYLYGVLAKEKSNESSLPYDTYLEKFNRATDALKDFDRPLAQTIGALIAFHFNNFAEANELAGASRVGMVANRFACWLSGKAAETEKPTCQQDHTALERLLTDADAERLLVWSATELPDIMSRLPDIEDVLTTDIPEFDRTKIRLLLSELYVQAARRHARELRNSTALGVWAERFLEHLSDI